MAVVPRDALAEFTRDNVARHERWDGFHAFLSLLWEDEQLRVSTYSAIDPGYEPEQYPLVMLGQAAREMQEHHDLQPVAYLLQTEGWMVAEPPASAPEADRELYHRLRVTRRFDQHPDRIENVIGLCGDVHGRLFYAERRRGERPGRTAAAEDVGGWRRR